MGRPIKADLSKDEVDARDCDRNIGEGNFAKIVEAMRQEPVPWVNIEGVDKADLLVKLWKNGRSRGGRQCLDHDDRLFRCKAEALIDFCPRVDFFLDRIIEVDFSLTEVDPRVYDRENYQGAFAHAVAEVREDESRWRALVANLKDK
jgi:hypothetical protein